MPCSSCGGGAAAAAASAPEQMFTVTLPNGEVKTLNDHESKVAITMAGGGHREPVKK